MELCEDVLFIGSIWMWEKKRMLGFHLFKFCLFEMICFEMFHHLLIIFSMEGQSWLWIIRLMKFLSFIVFILEIDVFKSWLFQNWLILFLPFLFEIHCFLQISLRFFYPCLIFILMRSLVIKFLAKVRFVCLNEFIFECVQLNFHWFSRFFNVCLGCRFFFFVFFVLFWWFWLFFCFTFKWICAIQFFLFYSGVFDVFIKFDDFFGCFLHLFFFWLFFSFFLIWSLLTFSFFLFVLRLICVSLEKRVGCCVWRISCFQLWIQKFWPFRMVVNFLN